MADDTRVGDPGRPQTQDEERVFPDDVRSVANDDEDEADESDVEEDEDDEDEDEDDELDDDDLDDEDAEDEDPEGDAIEAGNEDGPLV